MASPASGPTNVGLAPNVAALLCYVPTCCFLGIIFAGVVAIVEKQSRFLRFHAFQSLLLNAAVIVLWVGSMIIRTVMAFSGLGFVTLLAMLLTWLVLLAAAGFSIFMMVKANGGEEFQLPVIGDLARKWA